jgi:hypothetical protein
MKQIHSFGEGIQHPVLSSLLIIGTFRPGIKGPPPTKVIKSVILPLQRFFKRIWAHFRRKAPETGLSGVPLRSILCAGRKERSNPEGLPPLQSLARQIFRQL